MTLSISNRKMNCEIILGLLIGMFISVSASAQFMRTTIQVTGSIATEQVEPLAVTFSKNNDKLLASANTTALFSISGNDDVNVLVRVQSPEYLVSEGDARVPFNMDFAWQNNGTRNMATAHRSTNSQATFSLRNGITPNIESMGNVRNAYLFLDGSADITNVNAKELSGDITLTIEFE